MVLAIRRHRLALPVKASAVTQAAFIHGMVVNSLMPIAKGRFMEISSDAHNSPDGAREPLCINFVRSADWP